MEDNFLFQGVNPLGTSHSKVFFLCGHGILPGICSLFHGSAGPCEDPAPGWASHWMHQGILGISTPVPWNNLQSRSFPLFPLQNSICAMICFFQLNSNSRGVITVPDGISRTWEKLPAASHRIQPRSLPKFGHANPIPMEKRQDGLEKEQNGGKPPE